MNNIESALERNRAFAAAGGHQGAIVFPNLRLFVITCLDPRVDPAHFLGLALSDAIVVRNVGGRVTPEVINDVAFINQITENLLHDGPLFEVAVIHHTQCGTGAFADDTFRHSYANRIGVEESTLHEHAILDPVATATRDVERLQSAPAISPRVTISGHVYDVVTGLVETVIPARSSADRTFQQPQIPQEPMSRAGPLADTRSCLLSNARRSASSARRSARPALSAPAESSRPKRSLTQLTVSGGAAITSTLASTAISSSGPSQRISARVRSYGARLPEPPGLPSA